MGAPAIYHIPSRRRSGCALSSASVNPATNGVDKRLVNGANYENYLKVGKNFYIFNLLISMASALPKGCPPNCCPKKGFNNLFEI